MYVFVATLDNRTSQICQELDGKKFKLSEAEEGVNYPPMHPYCRSTVRAYISDDVEKSLKRRARDENGKNTVVDNMSYSEWASKNVQEDVLNNFSNPLIEKGPFKYTWNDNVTEAQKYAEKFLDKNNSNYGGVSYKGLSIESVNEINSALDSFYSQFDVEKLGRIKAIRPNTREHRKLFIDGAVMKFHRTTNWLNINTEKCYDIEKYAEGIKKSRERIKHFIDNKQLYYDKCKDKQDVLHILNDSINSGRYTVPENVSEAIIHELGHSVEKYVTNHANWPEIRTNITRFNTHISGYACENEHEYIAESFVSYFKGENYVDPKLREVFDSIRRK